jgi:hypothetical protein
MISVPSLLVGAVLGALLSTWFRYFIVRPSLNALGSGGGGGPGPGFHINHLSISNRPGLFGIKVRPTTLFGLRIHPDWEFGLVVERNAARKCSAQLIDKETNRHIQHLWWRLRDGSIGRTIDISSGETEQLMIFARWNKKRPNILSSSRRAQPITRQKFHPMT